jgi:hypothetical protein
MMDFASQEVVRVCYQTLGIYRLGKEADYQAVTRLIAPWTRSTIRWPLSDPTVGRVFPKESCGTMRERRNHFEECCLWLNEQKHAIFGHLEQMMDVRESPSRSQVMKHLPEEQPVSKVCQLFLHQAVRVNEHELAKIVSES